MTYSWRLYYDATVPYFGETHLPYAILAIVHVILAILPLPCCSSVLFSWFQKFQNILPFRWYIQHAFMDTFQGCYRDGTEPGTGDYRWFASIFFMLRILLALVDILTLGRTYFFASFFFCPYSCFHGPVSTLQTKLQQPCYYQCYILPTAHSVSHLCPWSSGK